MHNIDVFVLSHHDSFAYTHALPLPYADTHSYSLQVSPLSLYSLLVYCYRAIYYFVYILFLEFVLIQEFDLTSLNNLHILCVPIISVCTPCACVFWCRCLESHCETCLHGSTHHSTHQCAQRHPQVTAVFSHVMSDLTHQQ
jgi:hypothetical protein